MTIAHVSEILQTNETDLINAVKNGSVDHISRNSPIPRDALRALLSDAGWSYEFKTVAHINLRGGIGKTTASITLAARAAQYGYQTCTLDLDPQGSASLAFNVIPEDNDHIFYDLWNKPGSELINALYEVQPSLYLLPSSLENSLLDSAMSNPKSQKTAVREACNALKDDGFDLVVIDCPPSLGAAVISTICAADIIVIPVWSDPFSLKGLELTLGEIEAICDAFSLPMPVIKILYSRYDRREKISQQSLEFLRERFAKYALPDAIRTSSEFSKALARNETVFDSRRKSTAAEDYDRYIRTVLQTKPSTTMDA